MRLIMLRGARRRIWNDYRKIAEAATACIPARAILQPNRLR